MSTFPDLTYVQSRARGIVSAWDEIPNIFVNMAAAGYPTANLAIYAPIRLTLPMDVDRFLISNGSPANVNVDVGIYDKWGNAIWRSGSTAQGPSNDLQVFNISPFLLGPGIYYLAIAMDGTTGQLMSVAGGLQFIRALGWLNQATAFTLPQTATFAKATAAYMPLLSLASPGVTV